MHGKLDHQQTTARVAFPLKRALKAMM